MTLLRLERFAQAASVVALLAFTSGGCHSAFVSATVVNRSGAAVRLIEVDYPSASFGTEELANGATFKYRFKIQGSGAAKLSWTDSQEKDHTSAGPDLHEGQEGSLSVTIEPGNATWSAGLHP